MKVTWTDDATEEIWRRLRYLKSPFNSKRLIEGGIGGNRPAFELGPPQLERKALSISACMKQADEYFTASNRVGLATRPLLQFYGVQSLAKALILANDAISSLDDLKYHGLATRWTTAKKSRQELKTYCESADTWTIEQEYAVSHDGVFLRLAEVAEGVKLQPGEIMRFKEVLRLLPDLAELFALHYNEHSHCARFGGHKPTPLPSGKLQLAFSSPERVDEAMKVFPEFARDFKRDAKSNKVLVSNNAMKVLPSYCGLSEGTFVGHFLVRPHISGFCSTILSLYVLSFILSNIVRYKPAFWMDIVEGRTSGSASIAEAVCNLVDRRVPNDVLDIIWGENHRYSGTAYYADY